MARILAVDDQPHMTHIIAHWLTEQGHEVVCASDGARALELLRAESFDVLVTDVDMPGMDGLTLLRQRDLIDRLLAVVVLTGRSDYADLHGPPGGAKVHFLPKPFSPSELARLVSAACCEPSLKGS
jgi:CheY-like chemotaxis protein